MAKQKGIVLRKRNKDGLPAKRVDKALPTGGKDLESREASEVAYNKTSGGIHQNRKDIGKKGSEQAREEPKNRQARYEAILKASISEHTDALAHIHDAGVARELGHPNPRQHQSQHQRR